MMGIEMLMNYSFGFDCGSTQSVSPATSMIRACWPARSGLDVGYFPTKVPKLSVSRTSSVNGSISSGAAKFLNRSTWKIKPTADCDDEHIIQFWDDILRFIATIKLKETTASDIFRRLNS